MVTCHRDVATASLLAAVNPKASGRYLVGSTSRIPPSEVASYLGELGLQVKIEPGKSKMVLASGLKEIDTTRLEADLALKLRNLRSTIQDMAVQAFSRQDRHLE